MIADVLRVATPIRLPVTRVDAAHYAALPAVNLPTDYRIATTLFCATRPFAICQFEPWLYLLRTHHALPSHRRRVFSSVVLLDIHGMFNC